MISEPRVSIRISIFHHSLTSLLSQSTATNVETLSPNQWMIPCFYSIHIIKDKSWFLHLPMVTIILLGSMQLQVHCQQNLSSALLIVPIPWRDSSSSNHAAWFVATVWCFHGCSTHQIMMESVIYDDSNADVWADLHEWFS